MSQQRYQSSQSIPVTCAPLGKKLADFRQHRLGHSFLPAALFTRCWNIRRNSR